MTELVTIKGRSIPEVWLWAAGGALAVFTGIPAAMAAIWLAPVPLGPVTLAAFALLSFLVRSSKSLVVIRVWSVAAWAVVIGPSLLGVLVVAGLVFPLSTPYVAIGLLGLTGWLVTSAIVAALAYRIGRLWLRRSRGSAG